MKLHAKNSSAVRGVLESSNIVGARSFAFGIHGIGVDEVKGRAVRNSFEQWRTAAPGCPHPIPSDLRHGERALESPHFATKQTKARRRSHLVRKVEKQLMADADAEQRSAARGGIANRVVDAPFAQPLHGS